MAGKPQPGVRLLLWLFILIGICVIGFGFYDLSRCLLSKNWPIAMATITKSDMRAIRNTRHRVHHSYSDDLKYVYQVRGTNYTGTRLAFDDFTGSARRVKKIMDRYPVDKRVLVHYSPSDPKLAVLEPGIHGGIWICFGIGSIFILFGWMTLGRMRKNENSENAEDRSGAPPPLAGVIFIMAGLLICLVQAMDGEGEWPMYAIGALFAVAGIFLMNVRSFTRKYYGVGDF